MKKIRKQIYDLTLDDLTLSEVWEFAGDEEGEIGQDEATVRPYEYKKNFEMPDGIFIVPAAFMLADGSAARGYLTPSFHEPNSLGATQPVIITAEGQVTFWRGVMAPSKKQIREDYALLGKAVDQVFPIKFESIMLIDGKSIEGEIPGFVILEDIQSGETRVVR